MDNEQSGLPTDDLLDRATASLREAIVPPGPSAEVLARALEVSATGRPSKAWGFQARFLARGNLRKLVAAGVAASVIGAVLYLLIGRSAPLALADVFERASRTRSFTCILADPDEPKQQMKVMAKGLDLRIETPDAIIHWEKSTGRMLTLTNDRHEATRTQLADQRFDLYGLFKDYHSSKEKPVGEKVIAGRSTRGFELTRPGLMPGEPEETWTFWVDPASQLPVQIAVRNTGTNELTVFTDLRFDVALDDALFDMTIPNGYTVHDMGGIATSQLRAPPTSREADGMTLTPLVGIGAVRFGASKEQVIAAFGPPDSVTLKGAGLEYPSKGFGLIVHPRAGLCSILCYSEAGAGPFAANGFVGRTDKGIVMGDSRAAIEAAYGKNAVVTGDMSMLEYKDLRLTFVLAGDRLGHIMLTAPDAPEQLQK